MSTQKPLPYEKTLHVRDTCLCFRVQRAARSLSRVFDEAFRPFGITNGQFSLMMSLNRPQPPTMGEVAALLGMDRTTLTAALKALARRGLVAVGPDPRDRRSRRLVLLPAGRVLLGETYPVWEATHAAIERELAPVKPATLRRALARIGGGLPGATRRDRASRAGAAASRSRAG